MKLLPENTVFVGIDPSLSATAVVIVNLQGELIHSKVCKVKTTGPERLRDIREEVVDILHHNDLFGDGDEADNEYYIPLVAIEHYAMGCKFGRETAGELGGVLRVMMYEKNIPYIEVPPLQLKKFATGKATAQKDHILMSVYKKWGIEFKTNDEADAYVLARMARCIEFAKREKHINVTGYELEVIQNILEPSEKKAKGKKSKKDAA
jgi:Holliday junction resolvasome, endonuclease subunit